MFRDDGARNRCARIPRQTTPILANVPAACTRAGAIFCDGKPFRDFSPPILDSFVVEEPHLARLSPSFSWNESSFAHSPCKLVEQLSNKPLHNARSACIVRPQSFFNAAALVCLLIGWEPLDRQQRAPTMLPNIFFEFDWSSPPAMSSGGGGSLPRMSRTDLDPALVDVEPCARI